MALQALTPPWGCLVLAHTQDPAASGGILGMS